MGAPIAPVLKPLNRLSQWSQFTPLPTTNLDATCDIKVAFLYSAVTRSQVTTSSIKRTVAACADEHTTP
ncbi:hypothetical protein RR46_05511 [Papilio xuthus]|uniref:Uncharacterized protein n=1 Tax=Papilio xuthus TaxID=66420 RepID=A0A194Q167_PAPXU|nr:hypothetical protein RR46_05511 [Papilio xuthus]